MSDHPLPRRPGSTPEPRDYTGENPAADKAAVDAATMKEGRLREFEAAILSSPAGREWLWGVLNGADLYEDRIEVSGAESQAQFFRGRQSVAKGMMRRFCRVSPDNWGRMHLENDNV